MSVLLNGSATRKGATPACADGVPEQHYLLRVAEKGPDCRETGRFLRNSAMYGLPLTGCHLRHKLEVITRDSQS